MIGEESESETGQISVSNKESTAAIISKKDTVDLVTLILRSIIQPLQDAMMAGPPPGRIGMETAKGYALL